MLLKKGKQEVVIRPIFIYNYAIFLQYLKEVVFANFDVNQGKVDLSRHSSSHGVAEVEKYTKERALQMILILDQIFFYL